jgi:hypothetical protein
MGIVLSLLAFVGLVAGEAPGADSRVADLRAALDRAVMLHEAATGHRDSALEFPDPETAAEREMNLDLLYMELDGGYLARTCVCEPDRVFGMRLMIAYTRWLRLLGNRDEEIVDRLAAGAGDHGPEVRQLLEFAGLDNIDRFICIDYMRIALQQGVTERTLREYIDDLAAPKREPEPWRGVTRLASAR